VFPRISPDQLQALDARRICIVKPSAFGDVVQALPLLPALRARFPQAHLAWVIKRELADLLVGHPDLDELIAADFHAPWRDRYRFAVEMRQRAFDLVFDLQGLFRTGLITAASGAPMRIGLETAREGARFACHGLLPDTGKDIPAHQRYWRVAELLGVGHTSRQTHVWTSEESRQWAMGHRAAFRGLAVAFHPGAKWVTKRWPVEKFAAIASRVIGEYHASLVFVGDRSDHVLGNQLEAALQRTRNSGSVLNLIGQTSLKQLAALLERVDLLVTNDSGPMHLAAGLGTPVLGIFTCTSPIRSGPPGEQHQLVSTQVECAASYRKRCPRQGACQLACLRELDTERVWSALQRSMDRHALGRLVA
jgi:lipopolysaccharide heptosyltransferase II